MAFAAARRRDGRVKRQRQRAVSVLTGAVTVPGRPPQCHE